MGAAAFPSLSFDDPPPSGTIVEASVRSISAISTYYEDGVLKGEQDVIFEYPICICSPSGGWAHFTIQIPHIRYTGQCGVDGKCVLRAPLPPTTDPVTFNVYAPVDGNSCIGGAKLTWIWDPDPAISCSNHATCELPSVSAAGFITESVSKTPCPVTGNPGL